MCAGEGAAGERRCAGAGCAVRGCGIGFGGGVPAERIVGVLGWREIVDGGPPGVGTVCPSWDGLAGFLCGAVAASVGLGGFRAERGDELAGHHDAAGVFLWKVVLLGLVEGGWGRWKRGQVVHGCEFFDRCEGFGGSRDGRIAFRLAARGGKGLLFVLADGDGVLGAAGVEVGHLALVGAVERDGALVDNKPRLGLGRGGGLDGAVVFETTGAVDEPALG